MYKYGPRSRRCLATCDPQIQMVWNEIIKHRDNSVLEGHRNQETQDSYFAAGRSKLQWPDSNHNEFPSKAIDSVPYPFKPEWWDVKKYRHIWVEWGSWVVGFAAAMGVKLRWGMDWDRDHDVTDHTFLDGPHFELVE